MSASVFEHPWLGGLFGDPEIQSFWSTEAQLTHMLAFERALATAQEALGVLTADEGKEAIAAIDTYTPDIADLRAGTIKDGLVNPAFVKQLKQGSKHVHKGATSQDVIDTALVLTLQNVAAATAARLTAIIRSLKQLEAANTGNQMMGRTRMQAALPIDAGYRISTWRAPLERHLERLTAASKTVAQLQLGGPVGDRSSLGTKATEIGQQMARDLGLGATDASWHAMRDNVVDFANVMSLISGSLGKFGEDVFLMAQQGIDDIKVAGGGSSSAMAHKSNPVQAELLTTLAHFNAGQMALMHTAMLHEQERSGVAWALEWMTLPQMTVATGCGLATAQALLDRIESVGQPG